MCQKLEMMYRHDYAEIYCYDHLEIYFVKITFSDKKNLFSILHLPLFLWKIIMDC